ncbi:MAG: cation:proton antiporter [Endomicrobiaceae bacterium]
MSQHLNIILTLTSGLTAALILGFITQKIKLSPIVGYLLAGIIISPYSPGYIADIEVAQQFAEIGVVLLMFGVGLNFHLSDLISVYKISFFGAIVQSSVTAVITMITTHFFGWSWSAGLVFGISVSVTSTVVLIKVLSDNRHLHTPVGHTAVGWLVTEDIFTILVLVLLPVFFTTQTAGTSGLQMWATFGITILKLAVFTAFTLIVGQKILPLLLSFVAKTGTRELFTLSVLVLALGIAVGAAHFFGASMALGAFLAGMVVGQSDFSARATSEALPISDAFAVLFFVSVGMLFNPSSLFTSWPLLLAVLVIVLILKPVIATAFVYLLKNPIKKSVSVGISLGQIGEFSFILVSLGMTLGILPEEANSAIIFVAILSITLNTVMYKFVDQITHFLLKIGIGNKSYTIDDEIEQLTKELRHVIVVGYGPVGKSVTKILLKNDINVVIIEMNIDTVRMIRKQKIEGLHAIHGDAAQTEILMCSGIETAESFVISAPNAPAEEIIELVHSLNPRISILVHTKYSRQAKILQKTGIPIVFSGEVSAALSLSKFVLKKLGTLDKDIETELQSIHEELA